MSIMIPGSGGEWPRRIACLSTETVEVLYALGQEARIAGISGFTTSPARARKEKPKISGFSSAKLERILAVEPDLVLAFSDLQADIVRDCIQAGLPVHVFNQRDVVGIFDAVHTLGRLCGVPDRAAALVAETRAGIVRLAGTQPADAPRPRVYFEEWDEPMICGIGWVSELIALAGGDDVFAGRARSGTAGRRIVTPEEVLAAEPDLIFASWCGKRFVPERLRARPGFDALPAVRNNQLFEIKSAAILSPGLAAIERGLPELAAAINDWRLQHV